MTPPAWFADITRKVPLTFWLAAIALIIVDFMLRVWVVDDHELKRFTKPKVPKAAVESAASARAESRVAAWMPVLSPEREAKKMERTIALEGVFIRRSSRVAMLALTAAEGGGVERVRVTIGDQIDGWTVDTVSGRRVTLSRNGESRELLILRGRADVGNQ